MANWWEPSKVNTNPFKYNSGFTPTSFNGESGPEAAQFLSPFDESGNLKSQFQLSENTPSAVDPRALNQIRERALGSGLTDWGQLLMQKQGMEQQGALDSADQGMRTQNAEAMDNMARFGGYDAGAAERISNQAGRDLNSSRQNIFNQGASQRLGIYQASQDERNNLLAALPGMQNDDAKMKAYNIDNQLKGMSALNNFNQDTYKTAMSGWGARQTADADRAAANKSGGFLGSWLCTEAKKEGIVSRKQVGLLSKFRKFAAKFNAEVAHFYGHECDELLANMKNSQDNWKEENNKFISEVLSLLESNELEKAYTFYLNHIISLIKKYWSNCEKLTWLTEEAKAVN